MSSTVEGPGHSGLMTQITNPKICSEMTTLLFLSYCMVDVQTPTSKQVKT